ncbi:MAG TPA: glycosyltransferase family 39 protein [Candidatus Acidoferrum sp.]|nr:glycosyltransferase family 39 protein [Candidatus Acidoferrum sp.]
MLTADEVKKPGPAKAQTRAEDRSWLLLTGLLLLPIIVAAVRWILDHPYGIHWDEALYFNNVLRDLHNLYSGSPRQLGSILIGGDIRRPPANLLLALPFLALFGFHTAIARLVTLACWGVSGWLTYLTTRRMSSPAAGALAVLIFCLSPEVMSASIFFSTEGPFFLATAAMLYFISFYWNDGVEHPRGWIGLGLAIGLGLLSKSSFILLALPVLAITMFLLIRRNHLSLSAWAPFLKGGAIAFVVAAPWWLKNLGPALNYTKFAREQPRNSLGDPSLVTWAKWFFTVVVSLIGPGLSILIGIVAVVAIRKIIIKKEISLGPVHRAALIACGCAVLPLMVLQLSGTNHLLRYLCPAVIPFAIVVGVLSDVSGWIRSRAAIVLSGTLAFAQILMFVAPVAFPNRQPVDPGFYNGGLPWRIMVRFEQWDWKLLRDISQSCGLEKPKIAFLGMGRPLNPPQILYPWFVAGASPSERNGYFEPQWLWRYEQGPLDWQQVMSSAEQSDIVLTAPTFVGQATDRQNLDNQYNREFAARLAADPLFRGPIRLEMGRFEPVEVLVFVRKTLVCQSGSVGQAAR